MKIPHLYLQKLKRMYNEREAAHMQMDGRFSKFETKERRTT